MDFPKEKIPIYCYIRKNRGISFSKQKICGKIFPLYCLARSRSQLGRARAFTLDTIPMAAYRVIMEEPP